MNQQAIRLLSAGKTPLETFNIMAKDLEGLDERTIKAMKAEFWDAIIMARNYLFGRPKPVRRYIRRSKCR